MRTLGNQRPKEEEETSRKDALISEIGHVVEFYYEGKGKAQCKGDASRTLNCAAFGQHASACAKIVSVVMIFQSSVSF